MPSSLIFVGLVVLWLLILVPTIARRQQEVARLSPALLSGRVLERPMRHRYPEVGLMERPGPSTVGELVEARDDVPGPRERADRYDEFEAEIDDDGRVHGLDDDDVDEDPQGALDEEPGRGWTDRERDPRSGPPATGAERDGTAADGTAATEGTAETADGDEIDDMDDRDMDDRDDDRDPDGDLVDPIDEVGELDGIDDGFDTDVDAEEHHPIRYRPGRGGFDPEAAAAAAHAKYAFRQRVVLALLVLLVAAGVTALLVSAVFWWVAGALGVAVAGYLTYLRRQVRIEESIRARRAARLDGSRRRPAVDEHADDEAWLDDEPGADRTEPGRTGGDAESTDEAEDEVDWTADDGEPTRVRGTGEPLGVLPARRRTVDGPAPTEHPESSLPPLDATPPPPAPEGTSLVDVDAEADPDAFDDLTPHRRAVGE